eukprot:3247515-Pleurochrysis_carterae.AAC.5
MPVSLCERVRSFSNARPAFKYVCPCVFARDVGRCRHGECRRQRVSERDILGTQLIKRNDELGQLYEKIKIQQSTLNRGEQVVKRARMEEVGKASVSLA